jgi:predicted site-specific integrase-resolvase
MRNFAMAKQKALTGPLYTTSPAARAAGCSDSTAKRYVREGVVTPITTIEGVAICNEQNIREIRDKLGR